MNAHDSSMVPVIGRVDPQGRLVEADAALLELVVRAGGGIGTALALPELAALARLAWRLGIAIARSVTIADGADDLEITARATPAPDGVTLELTGWWPRQAWRPPADPMLNEAEFARAEADWGWEADAGLRLTHIAQDAGPRFGFDAAALLGQPLVRLFALGEDADGGFPILAAVAGQGGFDRQRAELRGSGKPVLLSATPRIDPRGRFAGFVGATRMIEVAAEAAPPSAFPTGFGARLDRSLRTPLERIIANAGSMSAGVDGPLAPGYAGYADDIATAGRHLLGLVDDLVDLEALERDDFATITEPIDLADVARRAAGLLSVRAAQADVRIDRPAPDETLPANGDFRRALQVLVNLIGNALRYSPSGAQVWVRSAREGGEVQAIVADQGKGIAIADQDRIFEKFERVDPGEAGGSGLGLYISRKLARAMGGDLTVDSAPGQGARFTFTLPARR